MREKSLASIILFIGFISIVRAGFSQEGLSVDEIVARAQTAAFYQAKDGKAKVEMTITDAQGRKRQREFVILRKDDEDGGNQKYFIYFQTPPDIRNMVFMVHKNSSGDDDRWLYLPALDLVKRISSGDKRTSFVGSHFVYEDVSGRGLSEDSHKLIETDETYYVVDNIPKEIQAVEFDHYMVWINKKTFMPEKIEYFKNDESYRVIKAESLQEIGGHITIIKSKVSDKRVGGYTESVFSKVKYDIGLEDDIFTERYLRQPPRRLLR